MGINIRPGPMVRYDAVCNKGYCLYCIEGLPILSVNYAHFLLNSSYIACFQSDAVACKSSQLYLALMQKES